MSFGQNGCSMSLAKTHQRLTLHSASRPTADGFQTRTFSKTHAQISKLQNGHEPCPLGKNMFWVCSKIGEGGTHLRVKWQQKLHAKQELVCCFNMRGPLESHAVDTATASTNQADLHIAKMLIPCALFKSIKKMGNGRPTQVACGVHARHVRDSHADSERETNDLAVGRGGLGKATRHRRGDGMRWWRRG